MYNPYHKIGEGSADLAKNFNQKSVKIGIKFIDEGVIPYTPKKGEFFVSFGILAKDEEYEGDLYPGQVLIRTGKVHFYDRYPYGGGPFKISDFENPEFRRRAEIIAENIEMLLKE